MTEELGDLLESFPGAVNRTRCFLHVLNLVTKSVIRQFDVPKAQADQVWSEAQAELIRISDGMDINEWITQAERDGEDDEGDEDDGEGWIDKCKSLSPEDRQALDDSTRLVKLVLAKVSS